MTSPPRPALNPDNPWPGLDPFEEGDRKYFHGREEEIAELLRLVRREPLTVLFGRSGLGKTSLLRAGLFPSLRDEDDLPVYVRLDHRPSAPPPREQVLAALRDACDAETVEAAAPAPGDDLWSFFHRRDTEFWSARSRPITPVLVLDQFEEIFTLGGDREVAARSASFLVELADLIEGRPPEAVKQALEADPAAAARFDFKRAAVKLVLSFREDFLAQMEGLKRQMPSLMHNRFRLLAMSGAQAYAVITNAGGHLVDDEIARRIIRLAWSNEPAPPVERSEFPQIEIDPALLSVVCSELNQKRLQARPPLPRITAALLEGADREILAGFYERSMAGLDPRVRTFVEDELITDRGFRDSHAFDDALALPGVDRAAIDALIARRLLRVDERGAVRRLELTHDVLTRVVKDSRDSRRAREAEAAAEARERLAIEQQWRNRRNGAFVLAGALLVVVLVVVTGWFAWEARRSASEAEGERVRAMTLATVAQGLKTRADGATTKALEEQGKAKDAGIQAAKDRERADVEQNVAKQALAVSGRLRVEAVALSRQADAEKRRAEALLREAESTRRMAHADRLQETAYDASLLVNLEAIRAVATPDARAGLLRRFASHPHLVAFLRGHTQLVQAVAFTSDGKRLASAGYDRTIMLWDVGSRKILSTLRGHDGAVNGLAFSRDGKHLASASDDKTVILWAADSGKLLGPLRGHDREVREVAFSPDGKRLASAGRDRMVIVWDVDSRRELARAEARDGPVGHIAFSPEGTRLASAGSAVTVWDATTLEPLATLDGHGSGVTGLAFSPDGKGLASASFDRTINVWDRDTWKSRLRLRGHGDGVNGVAFSPDGKLLASASFDKTVVVWDLATEKPAMTLRGHDDGVLGVAFSPDGKHLASSSRNDMVILWDVATRKALVELPGGGRLKDGVDDVAFSRDGTRLALATFDKTIRLWDLVTRKTLPPLGHTSAVTGISFSPDGKGLALASLDSEVVIRDLQAGTALATLKGHNDSVWGVAFSPDGAWLASTSLDGAALWDVKTETPARLESAKGTRFGTVVFSADGKRIASASASEVYVWDLPTRKILRRLKGRDAPRSPLALSPDGKRLASASREGTVVLWDVETSNALATLEGHAKAVNGVAFSPDGTQLASGSADKQVVLWDVATRRPVATLSGLPAGVNGVAFSPRGEVLAVAGADRTVALWEVGPDRLAEEACRTANRNLTCQEWRNYMGAGTPYRKTCEALPGPPACE